MLVTSSSLPAVFVLREAIRASIESGAASEALTDAYHASVVHSTRDGVNAIFLANQVDKMTDLPTAVQAALDEVRRG